MQVNAKEVRLYITANLSEIQSPRDVAAGLNVPYETLRKSVRREFKRTLGGLIRDARVRRAKKLLRETNKRCFEVSYEVGFRREDVAARVFKKQTGLSMQAYRHIHVK